MKQPYFVLAPMDDVTDVSFRRVVAECAPADMYMTEFVNVDGLCSQGRSRLLKKLVAAPEERLIIQIWGKNPNNYAKVTKQIAEGSLLVEAAASVGKGLTIEQAKTIVQGVDINMGCPDKTVVKNGCCSGLIDNRELASKIIRATQSAAPKGLPVSVKTRVGLKTVDMSWIQFLLEHNLRMLTIHARTQKQMSKVPADWSLIQQAVQMRDAAAPQTLVVGNGDVVNRSHGVRLAEETGADGIMIGRGIFADPFAFAESSPWVNMGKGQKLALFQRHFALFSEYWQGGDRHLVTLYKFAKVYCAGFDGAKELREQIMNAADLAAVQDLLSAHI